MASDLNLAKGEGVPLPAPGVLSITGEWAELIVGKSVLQVAAVGVVEHALDALPKKTEPLKKFGICCEAWGKFVESLPIQKVSQKTKMTFYLS